MMRPSATPTAAAAPRHGHAPAAVPVPARVAVVCPMAEEGWHSMDLVGDRLLEHLAAEHAAEFRAERVRPAMVRRAERLPAIGGGRAAALADRLLNRFGDYPRRLRALRGAFDLFHLVDHSYGQVARALPSSRLVVTLHDLDAFRCVLEPARDPRPRWRRAMAARQMEALRTAARVVCVSQAVADEAIALGVVPAERIRVAHNGIDEACTPRADPAADAGAARLLGPARADAPELLHVGSTVPRKRIDVLLRTAAAVLRERPGARLVRVGGPFDGEQAALARELGIGGPSLVVLPFLDRATLAAVYRRAAVVLQPSSAEGFGLPVAEALACGTPVVASDLPVLREVAGAAAGYRPVGDVAGWTRAVLELLAEREADGAAWEARRRRAAERGGRFSWREHAARVADVYREVLREAGGAPGPGRWARWTS